MGPLIRIWWMGPAALLFGLFGDCPETGRPIGGRAPLLCAARMHLCPRFKPVRLPGLYPGTATGSPAAGRDDPVARGRPPPCRRAGKGNA
ncbi:hypothetical protein [Methanosphaerula subterraneus]|uniref:hypothetical protein n=1 Tax=Methanosphaerula subterraneus TaxID=3350244 RepID=UPI003F870526